MTLRDYSSLVEFRKEEPLRLKDKKGTLIKVNPQFSDYLTEGKEFFLRGNFHSPTPRDHVERRTMFYETPIRINGRDYFVEVKGYGRDGEEIWFMEKDSGDVYFGMYLDQTQLEFERLQMARNLGLKVPFPVAVVHIPRQEYLEQGLEEFSEIVNKNLRDWDFKDDDFSANGFSPTDYFVSAEQIYNYLKNSEKGTEQGIKDLLSLFESRFGATPEWTSAAIQSGKEIGYLIRAVRCPYRVGGPSDKNLKTPRNISVAREVGKTFRVLLENRILHHCPSVGNFTLEGELTDLQDTFDLDSERERLRAHMESVGRSSPNDFVKYLIGPEHTGNLHPYFIEGMYGKRLDLGEAVGKTLELIA